jgi:hypothetical protein
VALVEAESFSGQGGGGQVRVYDRIGASGRMVTYWHEVIGHWLEWKLEVPATGDYRVTLKYATDSPETQRELTVDGASPGDAFTAIRLPSTGGFCTARNDWRYHTVGGETTPAAVHLTAGPHTVRMTNLRDGCALDFILLAPVAR